MDIRKVGIEEELMLVDPDSLRLTAVAQQALREDADDEVEAELFLQMLETSTAPAATADDLASVLREGRRAVGESVGLRSSFMGVEYQPGRQAFKLPYRDRDRRCQGWRAPSPRELP